MKPREVNSQITRGYDADRDTVLRLLNESLATALVCTLRRRQHHLMTCDVETESVRHGFLEHAPWELEHADCIAARDDEEQEHAEERARRLHGVSSAACGARS